MDKSASFQAIGENLTAAVRAALLPLANAARALLKRIGDPAEASYQLGRRLAQQELFLEAKYRFKFTLWLQPDRANAWYNLACCHLALDEKTEGVAALKKALAIRPKDEASLFMLATLDEGRYAEGFAPHTTPPELVQAEFALLAEDYEDLQLGALEYRGHLWIAEELQKLLPEGQSRFVHVLDAGCGTGLCGETLRPLAEELTGLDLTPEMLAQAAARRDEREKPLYDHTLAADARTHLLQQSAPVYDVIAAAELCPIMGGLAPLFDGAAKALKPGGWLIFTAVLLKQEGEQGYRLNPQTRRFEHSAAYLRRAAEHSGLLPALLKEGEIAAGQAACIVALQKPAAA